jgi:hypothetical protein
MHWEVDILPSERAPVSELCMKEVHLEENECERELEYKQALLYIKGVPDMGRFRRISAKTCTAL